MTGKFCTRICVATIAIAGLASVLGAQAPHAGTSCPISMYARHGVGGLVLNARSGAGEQPAGPSQHIHLVLGKAGDGADVAGVKVMVRGTSGRDRAIAAGAAGEANSDASRSFDLALTIGGDKTVATDLVLSGFTSVQSITLQSVTYADGSLWRPAGGQSCRIAPDPLMLIGGR